MMTRNHFSRRTASSRPSARRRRLDNGSISGEDGFTLIELLIVIVLVGITTAMFSTTFGSVMNRSSVVQSQNIIQTEVRASLNQMVADLRSANSGNANFPVISATDSSITFYSPDRLKPDSVNDVVGMRRVKYWLDGTALKRQVTTSTGYNAATSKWIGLDADTGPIQTVVAAVKLPATDDTTGAGWRQGQVFKYCVQAPPDMRIDPSNSTSAELITWSCDPATVVPKIKTVIVRVVMSANSRSSEYNFGAVATLRWNVS